jgi:hypothetical protein
MAELTENRFSGSGEVLKISERKFLSAVRIVRFCRFLEKRGSVSRTLAGQLL